MERRVHLKGIWSLLPIASGDSAPHQQPSIGNASGFSLPIGNSDSLALLSASRWSTARRRECAQKNAAVIRCDNGSSDTSQPVAMDRRTDDRLTENFLQRRATVRSLRCDLSNIVSTTKFAIELQSHGSQSSPEGTERPRTEMTVA